MSAPDTDSGVAAVAASGAKAAKAVLRALVHFASSAFSLRPVKKVEHFSLIPAGIRVVLWARAMVATRETTESDLNIVV